MAKTMKQSLQEEEVYPAMLVT